MKKSVAVLALIFCAVFLLSACAGTTNILGKWRSDSNNMASVEFKSDGTLTTYYDGQTTYSASYRTDGNKLIIKENGQEQAGTFKIEGNKLTITNPDNQTQVFTKE